MTRWFVRVLLPAAVVVSCASDEDALWGEDAPPFHLASSVHGLSAGYCAGATVPGKTAWQRYSSNSLYVDIDTSTCGFSATPLYFTTLGGTRNHWLTLGASSIYSPTRNGFRVYLKDLAKNVTPDEANRRKWHIAWEGVPKGDPVAVGEDFCAGQTSPYNTNWVQYGNSGVYVDVDTSQCTFDAVPNYITSIGGDRHHWTAYGATSIYRETASGFRVYVYWPGITAQSARQKGWRINWKATPKGSACTGETAKDAWKPYGSRGIYVDVDTSGCDRNDVLWYRTSLSGRSHHWKTTGATSLYASGENGFRVYVYNAAGEITPELAESRNWHIEWNAGYKSAAWKLEDVIAEQMCEDAAEVDCLAPFTIKACASGCPRYGYAYRVDTQGGMDLHMSHGYLKKLRNAALSEPSYKSPTTFDLPLSDFLWHQVQMLLRHPSAYYAKDREERELAEVVTRSRTVDPTKFDMVTWVRGGAAHAMSQADMGSWLVSVAMWYAQVAQPGEAGYYLALAEKVYDALSVPQSDGGVRNEKRGHRCHDGHYCYWFHSCPECSSLSLTTVLNQHLHAVRDALRSHVQLARWRDGELSLPGDSSRSAPFPDVVSPSFIDELRDLGRGGLLQLAFALGNQADASAPPNLSELMTDAGSTPCNRPYFRAAYRYVMKEGTRDIKPDNTCHYHYHSMDLLATILQLITNDPRFANDSDFSDIYYHLLYGRSPGDTRSCATSSADRYMTGVPLAEMYQGSIQHRCRGETYILPFQANCDGVVEEDDENGREDDDAAVWANTRAPHGPRVFFQEAYEGCVW
jgi:hypothetical protein